MQGQGSPSTTAALPAHGGCGGCDPAPQPVQPRKMPTGPRWLESLAPGGDSPLGVLPMYPSPAPSPAPIPPAGLARALAGDSRPDAHGAGAAWAGCGTRSPVLPSPGLRPLPSQGETEARWGTCSRPRSRAVEWQLQLCTEMAASPGAKVGVQAPPAQPSPMGGSGPRAARSSGVPSCPSLVPGMGHCGGWAARGQTAGRTHGRAPLSAGPTCDGAGLGWAGGGDEVGARTGSGIALEWGGRWDGDGMG